MQEDYAQQLVWGSKTLIKTPYMSAITVASTVDLAEIRDDANHPVIETRTFQSLSVHARLAADGDTVQFSVIRYTRDENNALVLQEADDPYTLTATARTDGASKHLSAPLDFSTKGADAIKLITVVVSSAEVDLWARAY